jgi:K+-sensing histidine kinase KdpD
MSSQLIEKVFEPFQSQFEGGTGLGLAIVYQIVQAHEGKVFARSKVGQGSVFVLRLRQFASNETLAGPQAVPAQAQSPALETISAAVVGGARG